MHNEPWIHRQSSYGFSTSSWVSLNLMLRYFKKFNPFKDFQSDQIQRSSHKILTAHYACRNADLNLTLVTGRTNKFIFQIINSLIESWGVRLTCLDCNCTDSWEGKRHILPDIIVMGKCEWLLEVWSLCLLYVLLMPLIHCIRAFSDNIATHKYVIWKLHAKTYLLKGRWKMCQDFFSQESHCGFDSRKWPPPMSNH